ncbi:unnamed protein product [Urochloa humidicola]
MQRNAEYHRQRVKKIWVRKGDRNTDFFHQAILKRTRKNRISSIQDTQGNTTADAHQIGTVFIDYFDNLFKTQLQQHPPQQIHLHHQPNQVPITDEFTSSIPDKQEIRTILQEMKRDASPGPDGLNVAFYRAAWQWISGDITDLIDDFYKTGTLPQHTNNTYIVLIPKRVNCLTPQDYRPISLCNVFYKIVAKSLAQRIKHHLPHLIHPSQHAFVKGRHITSNIILAQEIAHSFQLKSWKFPGFMLKLDLAKAFDRLEWSFVAQALRRQGFHDHFIQLVHCCISTASFSVLVNGQAFGSFSAQRGIRQVTGQTPNWGKSSILFSKHVSTQIKQQIKNLFPVSDLQPNTIHLGHPLIINQQDRLQAYDFIYDKFRNKLTTLKANKLNHAGRLAYIQSVFASIPIYYMAHVLFSKKLLAKITAIIRQFWWAGVKEEDAGKPMNFRAWTDICRDKQEGGLGIKRIDLVNKSLLIKMAWHIVSQKVPHLTAILKAKYYPNHSFWTAPLHTPRSLFWASILKIKTELHKQAFFQIANGNTNIWTHPWAPCWTEMHDKLQDTAPRTGIPNTVSDLWLPNSKTWDTHKIELFFGSHSVQQITEIPIINHNSDDFLCWRDSASGSCSSKQAYLSLRTKPHSYPYSRK